MNNSIDESYRMGQMDIDGHWFANIPKGATTGKHNGFTMLVDIEAFDYNYSDEGAEGLKVYKVQDLRRAFWKRYTFHIRILSNFKVLFLNSFRYHCCIISIYH